MKLIDFFNNKENDTFRITEPDRLWVEDNFRWLIEVFGYAYRESEQILLSENYFPKNFKSVSIFIENINKDLCSLLQIREDKISLEVVNEIRESYGMPFIIKPKEI